MTPLRVRLCCLPFLALPLALQAGCGLDLDADDDALAVDAEDEGAADANLDEDSILDFLNGPDATEETLRTEVHLRAPAPHNIAAHVRGPDGALGTADDDLIGDLAELDAIPRVGPKTIAAIEAYARARHQGDEVEVEGVAMSKDAAERILAMVNRVSQRVLDDDAGLDSRAAHNIVAARPIVDLPALAAVSYVGEDALVHLRDFVIARGNDVDALPAQCTAAGLDTPGPGALATDARAPELGDDVSVITRARVPLAAGVVHLERDAGPVIEAKMELNDAGALSLSLYPIAGLDLDAERATFREAAGDPTKAPFAFEMETFTDREHLVRSSRDLTLTQISQKSVADAAREVGGLVYWAIPTIERGHAGVGVYDMDPFTCESTYTFVDGSGDLSSNVEDLEDLGEGPGALATDARTPELGDNLSVVRTSRITMAQALAQLEQSDGPAIEAKFELDHDGHLSLSIYPIADLSLDPEHATFVEAAGDPTAAPFAPTRETFADDDVEHQTRSARDLTLVQTANLTLRDAVDAAQAQVPDGFVYWAIPTIRDARSGYGVYILDEEDGVHWFFVD